MRIWPCLGWPCPHKLPCPQDGWSFSSSQDPVLSVPPVMGPWVQGLFGSYSCFTPIMAYQKCVCGHVWGDPVPINCRVLRVDGHLTVARTLYYRYHQLWVPWSKGYLVHIAALPTIMADQECVCGVVWGDSAPTNCRVHRADGHFTVARTLYYRYHQLWVPWSKVYLVHITPLLP